MNLQELADSMIVRANCADLTDRERANVYRECAGDVLRHLRENTRAVVTAPEPTPDPTPDIDELGLPIGV
jgi:hypothetical protein